MEGSFVQRRLVARWKTSRVRPRSSNADDDGIIRELVSSNLQSPVDRSPANAAVPASNPALSSLILAVGSCSCVHVFFLFPVWSGEFPLL